VVRVHAANAGLELVDVLALGGTVDSRHTWRL
jgi:hypothetical protein